MIFGLHFVHQPDPYTAEHVALSVIYILWGVNYWLQFKLSNYISILLINTVLIILVAIYVFFIYYPVTFLEYFLE